MAQRKTKKTLVPLYFDTEGNYTHDGTNGIGFTIPKYTEIEFWDHGNQTKVRWIQKKKNQKPRVVRKIINMKRRDAENLINNKSAS